MTPGHPALPTDTCVSSRARPYKFERHNDRPFICENKSDMRGIKHGWYAIEVTATLSSGPFPSFEACVARIQSADERDDGV